MRPEGDYKPSRRSDYWKNPCWHRGGSMVPTGAAQLLVVAAFVMPGFVFQAARLRFRGQPPDERDQFSRTLRALGVSFAFAIAYFAAFGPAIKRLSTNHAVIFDHPVLAALSAFLVVFIVPMLTALIDLFIYWRIDGRNDGLDRRWAIWRALARVFTPAGYGTYSATPSARDHAARRRPREFVRIQFADSVWLGGYLGRSGFVNATPEPREIYLETAWHLDSGGNFTMPIRGSAGIWINCVSAIAVEYLDDYAKDSD